MKWAEMLMEAISRGLCAIGLHGPNWLGCGSQRRSARTAPFERTCDHCGAVWHGREVETRTMRTVGDWRRVK